MNNLGTFFAAPVTALFSPAVYRDAAKSSGGRGVLYSLYLAGLSTLLITAIFLGYALPKINDFADWARTNMPVLIWTPEGVSLENGQTTAELKHPQYGTIARFDMTSPAAPVPDMETTYILVTPKKVYIKKAPGQIEERDITGAAARPGQQLPPRVRVTGDIAGKVYENVRGAMVLIVPFLTLLLSFGGMAIANLFYSLVGLLFNQMRKEKLGYGAVFSLTCFATTAAFLLTWARVLILLRASKAWPGILDVPVNFLYIFLAMKLTEKKPEVS